MLISRCVWPGRTTTDAPLQQSADETVAHLYKNDDQPNCLTTFLAVLVVQRDKLVQTPGQQARCHSNEPKRTTCAYTGQEEC